VELGLVVSIEALQGAGRAGGSNTTLVHSCVNRSLNIIDPWEGKTVFRLTLIIPLNIVDKMPKADLEALSC
jgi:hypothetical protein